MEFMRPFGLVACPSVSLFYAAMITLLVVFPAESAMVHIAWCIYYWFFIYVNPLELAYGTFYYGSVGLQLARAIREYRIWDEPAAGKPVDFTAAYENYAAMKLALEAFTHTFRWFFFGAEFVLILSALVLPFSCWEAAQMYLAAPDLAGLLRIVWLLSIIGFYYPVIWGLATVAASITDAAQAIHLASHELVGRVAVLVPEQIDQAERFSGHLSKESERIGFSSFGIVINSGFIARVVYTSLGAVFALGSMLLQNKHWLDGDF
jgi:hypothetical protein